MSTHNNDNLHKHDKKTVYAYISGIQRLIRNQQIPLGINDICLLFFHQLDQFENKTRVCNTGNSSYWYPCFGRMDIMDSKDSSQFLYQWRFKWNRTIQSVSNPSMMIGITAAPNLYWTQNRICLGEYGYLYKSNWMTAQYKAIDRGKYDIQNLRNWNSLDRSIIPEAEIIMSLDIKENSMEFVVRRGECWYSITNISIRFPYKHLKYRMFVYYEGKVMDIDLIGFNKVRRTSGKIDERELILDQIKRNQQDARF